MDQPYVERGFLVRHGIDAFVVSLFTVTIIVLALAPGIGYTASARTSQRNIISGAHFTGSGYAVNRLFNGTVSAYFNPLLYPVSSLSGYTYVLREFSGASEFWDHEGTQLQEAAVLGTLFTEFAKNIPYFLGLGFLSSIILVRLSKTDKIIKFFEMHLPKIMKNTSEKGRGISIPLDETGGSTHTKRQLIRRIIAIQLIVSAYVIGYVGIVHWNMFWPILALVIMMIIIGAILF